MIERDDESVRCSFFFTFFYSFFIFIFFLLFDSIPYFYIFTVLFTFILRSVHCALGTDL